MAKLFGTLQFGCLLNVQYHEKAVGVTTLKRLDIFVSSPGNLNAERKIISRVVTRLNKLAHIRDRYSLNPLNYNELVPPESGGRPQDIVDRYLEIEKCYLLICMMWSRMGTPIHDAETGEDFPSGTVYEFTKAYQLNQERGLPRILVYRKVADDPKADPKQQKLVEAFFKRFEGADAEFKGLYQQFKSSAEFEDLIFGHIDNILAKYPPTDETVAPIDTTASAILIHTEAAVPDQPPDLIGRSESVEKVEKALVTEGGPPC